jgi:hypothetical protein
VGQVIIYFCQCDLPYLQVVNRCNSCLRNSGPCAVAREVELDAVAELEQCALNLHPGVRNEHSGLNG